MAMFYAVMFIILFLVAIFNLYSRLSRDNFNDNDKAQVKKGILKTLITSVVGIVLALFNIYAWNNVMQFNASTAVFALFASLGCFVAMIVLWSSAPSDASIKHREKTEKMNSELIDYKYDRVIQWRAIEFCLENSKSEIVVRNMLIAEYYTIPLSKIIECEILEDGTSVMKGGVGRAVIGGILAGGVGAIVGASTRKSKSAVNSLKVRIVTLDVNDAMRTIDIISSPMQTDSPDYAQASKFAQEVYSTITSIIANNEQNNQIQDVNRETESYNDVYVAIEKLAALRDKGILSESEFNRG